MSEDNTSVASTSIVALSGTVDVKSIHASFETLEQAFGGVLGTGAGLGVDLSAVTDADVTLIQLLESARRTADQSGIALHLCAPAEGPVLQTLERGGFLTEPPDARTRFWRGE